MDTSDSDDKLIAAIIKYKRETGNNNIYFATNDLGPRLKAGKFSIKCIIPDEKHMLKNPMDKIEKSNKLLKLENEQLKNNIPKLSVKFNTGGQFAKYEIIKNGHDQQEFIDSEMLKIKEKFSRYKLKEELEKEREIEKLKQQESPTNLGESDIQHLLKSMDFSGVSEERKEEYNSELIFFHVQYENYLKELFQYSKKKALTIEVNLEIINEGTSPAKDIDVYFHFPDGFELFDEFSFPEEPKKPQEPYKPRSMFDSSAPFIPQMILPIDYNNIPIAKSNTSSPSIKKSNSYDVNIHVEKLKHNTSESLDKMFIIYNSFDEISSFNTDYELRCSNVPNVIKGKLNFKIEKKDSI